MAVEPELLCLDEPFSALDVLSAESLRNDLVELWTSGQIPTKAILMVTHNIEEAVSLADRIIVMDKGPGRIVADLPVGLASRGSTPCQHSRHLWIESTAFSPAGHRPNTSKWALLPANPRRDTPRCPDCHQRPVRPLGPHGASCPAPMLDIYRLPERLGIDSDEVLILIEAAELLGFATVQQGDIALTPLGDTFVDAGILGRKGIFAVRIRRLPIFKWLLGMLRASDNHSLEWDVVQAALGFEFRPMKRKNSLTRLLTGGATPRCWPMTIVKR